jgi:uncharacterized OB-fold protein
MSERERIAQVVAGLHLPDVEWPLTGEFFAGAARGELLIPKCRGCGIWVWYPQALCPTCASREIQWHPVSGRGRVFTWVRVHRSFLPGLAQQVPYVTALVELEEDPMLRVPSMLMASDLLPAVGAPVEVCFVELQAEPRIVVPRFRLIAG